MLTKMECSDIAYDLISAEARQYPAAYMNWEHHLVEWWYESVYRTQFNLLSAIESPIGNPDSSTGETNHYQGQTYAADSSADDSVNRPDQFAATLAAARNCRCCRELRADPALPGQAAIAEALAALTVAHVLHGLQSEIMRS
jgi:hypothetical protein